jgi:hypothetical protein
MKKAFRVLLILGLVSSAWASPLKPAFRLWAAPGWSWYSGRPVIWTFPEVHVNYENKQAICFGAGVELSIPKSVFSLIAEIDYFQKGQKELWYYWDELLAERVYQLDVLSQVGLIKVKPANSIPVYALAGYEVSAILKHRYDDQNLNPDTKKVDFGPVVGGGLEARIKNIEVFLEGRYQSGLVNLSKQSGTLIDYHKLNSRGFILGLGLKFSSE